MQSHKIKFIVNPTADLGRAWRFASSLRPMAEEFVGLNGLADWSGTVYPRHATELARQAGEDGYELVIAVGGDGTVHEVVNGLMQLPAGQRPRLGVVPFGTGNDFSHAVGMDRQPARALRQIFTGQPRRVDVGVLTDEYGNTDYWDNAVGIGFDTIVTLRTRPIPFLHGFPVFFAAVIQTILFDHVAPHFRISTDKETWEADLLMQVLCNGGREGGGFFVSPEARPDDGLFHYVNIRKVSQFRLFRLLPEFMRGTHGQFPDVHMTTFKKIEIQADRPLCIHTDGEIFADLDRNVRCLQAEVIPGALEVMTG